MNIKKIAYDLNNASINFKIGKLQEIRKRIKSLTRRPGTNIFNDSTIKNDWACHYGGRSEIQFNIGIENDGFRYGLAFSLKSSISLPDISILFPKILKLNSLIREKPELFTAYKMWYYCNKRSNPSSIKEIPSEIIQKDTFIFFGKLIDESEITITKILSEFDKLLDIYIAVETDSENLIQLEKSRQEQFKFIRSERNLNYNRNYTSVECNTDIDIRHTMIQLGLKTQLEAIYGAENVSIENPVNGNRIDAVVKQDTGFAFYEIKTGVNAKSCIRQAIGQLLEYGYWNKSINVNSLIIVGEYPLTKEDDEYLNLLKNQFNLPVSYFHIIIKNKL